MLISFSYQQMFFTIKGTYDDYDDDDDNADDDEDDNNNDGFDDDDNDDTNYDCDNNFVLSEDYKLHVTTVTILGNWATDSY